MSRAGKVSGIDGSERTSADNHEIHFQIPVSENIRFEKSARLARRSIAYGSGAG
jgi:hypothetical protein